MWKRRSPGNRKIKDGLVNRSGDTPSGFQLRSYGLPNLDFPILNMRTEKLPFSHVSQFMGQQILATFFG